MPDAETVTVTATHEPPAANSHCAPDAMAGMLSAAIEQVLGSQSNVATLQLSRRGGLAVIHAPDDSFVFKLITCRADWKKRLFRPLGFNPARRARKVSKALEVAGVPVCKVLKFGDVPLPGAPRAVWTLSSFIRDGRTLRQLKQELQPDRSAPAATLIRELYIESLKLLRRIHDLGFEHRDYHAGNLLVVEVESGAPHLTLVDLETTLRREATIRRRARDLRRFLGNFTEAATAGESLKEALEIYSNGDTKLAQKLASTGRLKGLLKQHRM